MAKRHLLAVFEFSGGERHGFTASSHPVQVTLPGESSAMSFAVGISVGELPMRATATLGGGSSSSPSFVLSHPLVADLWTQRYASPMQAAIVTLWWWRDDRGLRPVDELYRGGVSSESWDLGAVPATVSGSLGTPFRVDDVPFPPNKIGDEGRFPDAPVDSYDHAVPVIYGVARGVPLRAISDITVVPGPGVYIDLLVAGHAVASGSFQVYRDGALVTNNTPVTGIDGRGAPYTYTRILASDYAGGGSLYAQVVFGRYDGPTPLSSMIKNLGDVIFDLVMSYGRWRLNDFDQRQFRSELVKLNRFQVGFYADQAEGTLYDFLSSRLAGQFGFAVSSNGKFGIEPTLWPDWQGQEPVAKLIEGQNAHREGDVVASGADSIVTEVEVDYRFDGYNGGTTQSVHLDAATDATARRSASRWNARYSTSVLARLSAPDVSGGVAASTFRDSSAYLVGVDHLNRFAGIRYHVEYRGLPDYFWELPLMALVHVTDADYGWDEEPMLIEGVRPDEDGTCDVLLVSAKAV